MEHWTWLLEALHLHLDENLSRVEAGGRLGIPKKRPFTIFLFVSGKLDFQGEEDEGGYVNYSLSVWPCR